MIRDSITDRIDVALEKFRWQRMEVRAIMLNKADYRALCQAVTRKWREETGSKTRLHPLAYRDHPIRFGKRSSIYSTQGIEVVVPLRLSHRVAA